MPTDTGKRRAGAKCSVARMLAEVTDAQSRRWLADAMDGKNPDFATPADAAYLAETQMGHEISAAIVRRHRRRISGVGEKCWCPA